MKEITFEWSVGNTLCFLSQTVSQFFFLHLITCELYYIPQCNRIRRQTFKVRIAVVNTLSVNIYFCLSFYELKIYQKCSPTKLVAFNLLLNVHVLPSLGRLLGVNGPLFQPKVTECIKRQFIQIHESKTALQTRVHVTILCKL